MSLDWIGARVTQGFGPTTTTLDGPYAGAAHFNKGIDFSVPVGTPIGANVSGVVVAAGDLGDGWGISVKLRDAEGNIHNYGHLANASVQQGQQISAGDLVGLSGNTGKSTGPHLSYDVKAADGQYVEPSRWLGGSFEGGSAMTTGASAAPPDFSQYDVANLPFSTSDYYVKYARWQALDLSVQRYEDAFNTWDSSGAADQGVPEPDLSQFLSPEELEEYRSLDADLARWESAYDTQGEDLDRLITIMDYHAKTDPRLTDARNAENQWNREMDIREEARMAATTQMQEQTERQDMAVANNMAQQQRQGAMFMAPAKKLDSWDSLFGKAQESIRAGLPEVPGAPYAPQLPVGMFGRAPATSGISSTGAVPASRRALSGIGNAALDRAGSAVAGATSISTPAGQRRGGHIDEAGNPVGQPEQRRVSPQVFQGLASRAWNAVSPRRSSSLNAPSSQTGAPTSSGQSVPLYGPRPR